MPWRHKLAPPQACQACVSIFWAQTRPHSHTCQKHWGFVQPAITNIVNLVCSRTDVRKGAVIEAFRASDGSQSFAKCFHDTVYLVTQLITARAVIHERCITTGAACAVTHDVVHSRRFECAKHVQLECTEYLKRRPYQISGVVYDCSFQQLIGHSICDKLDALLLHHTADDKCTNLGRWCQEAA